MIRPGKSGIARSWEETTWGAGADETDLAAHWHALAGGERTLACESYRAARAHLAELQRRDRLQGFVEVHRANLNANIARLRARRAFAGDGGYSIKSQKNSDSEPGGDPLSAILPLTLSEAQESGRRR